MKWGLLVVLALFLSFSGAAGEDDDYYYDYEYDYEEIRFIEAPWEYLNRRDRVRPDQIFFVVMILLIFDIFFVQHETSYFMISNYLCDTIYIMLFK